MNAFTSTNKKKIALAIVAVFLIGICFAGGFSVNKAQAAVSGDTNVLYTKTTDEIEPAVDEPYLSVSVGGNGEVVCATKDGSDTIRAAVKNYRLPEGEEMTFKLQTDKGAKLKEVTLNGTDVANKVKDNSITVKGSDKDQSLKIVFDNGKPFIKTGDNFYLLPLVILLIASAVVGAYAYYRNKRND